MSLRNGGDEAWVVLDGDVLDLSVVERCEKNRKVFRLAGADISHLRDEISIKKKILGKIGTSRFVRIVNTLSGQVDHLEVCDEETLEEIRERYRQFNDGSYAWKRLCGEEMILVDMSKTLGEQSMPNEQDLFDLLDIHSTHLPTLHLYYNDDLQQ